MKQKRMIKSAMDLGEFILKFAILLFALISISSALLLAMTLMHNGGKIQ